MDETEIKCVKLDINLIILFLYEVYSDNLWNTYNG